ncbi:hypothetical protein, partial [Rhizobium sp. PDO1-076]|uniref:hypothetical protein n=1 Tax=Rhizobium sp. PDO1-076 TaxID=1125979 RepID=UPI001FCAFF59
AEAPAPGLSWLERDAHDSQTLRELEDLASELGLVFGSVERQPALDLINVNEWSSGWQDGVMAAAQSLLNAIDLLVNSANGFVTRLGLKPEERLSRNELQALLGLARVLQKSRGHDITIVFDRDFARCAEALESLDSSIKAYRAADRAAAASYSAAAVRDLEADVLDHQWRRQALHSGRMRCLASAKFRSCSRATPSKAPRIQSGISLFCGA